MDRSDWNVEMAHLNEQYIAARIAMADAENRIKDEEKRLRNLVKVRETKTFWELTYNGRTIRVTPNARGEFKVTENKVKIAIPRGIRHTIPALRLAMAMGNL